jgi:branched-chain amino acid transport system substrate-binding protein
VQIVGDELHPIGRVKDFAPYAIKIKASGAQAVITGNWGNDLTLLVKAAKDVGYTGSFYTFYGNALGAPAAIGEAGVGKLIAVADWLPNYSNPKNVKGLDPSERFMQSFRARFPKPADDYVHMRMQLMVEALVGAINSAGASDALSIARELEKSKVSFSGQTGEMRASDHQFQQSLMVGVMGRKGDAGVTFDVEGSGYGFKVVRVLSSYQAALPTSCKMVRPL